VGQFPTGTVPLYLVSAGDSPRLSGLDKKHVRLLAGIPQQLPPILVHRPTMCVIDGAHRLEAARQRGDREIEVSYFDGDQDAAFVLAVRSNVMHGLPLTLADRTAAAARILGSYPDWSDRAIARATGLAAATIRGIRRRCAGDCSQPSTRIGSDGRMRPVDIAERRRLAGYLITKNPGASLREIAREAGISPATVQDVRRQRASGHDEVTPRHPAAGPGMHAVPGPGSREAPSPGPESARQPAVILQYLRRDPSLRSSETGRSLLRWLSVHSTGAQEWTGFLDSLPPHAAILVMEAARGIAHTWASFADELERRAKRNDFESA
jgi:transposase-like protein